MDPAPTLILKVSNTKITLTVSLHSHVLHCTSLYCSKLQECNKLYYNIVRAVLLCTVSVLGRDEGYTVKYNPLPEGVPEGEAQGNS